jgi:hypothetical protein
LMTNHFHLLLHCPEAGLSAFMQRLSSLYTRHLNHERRRDGPLFRSRFHSVSLRDIEHVMCVGRYIHRNPADIATVDRLDGYRWSSYRHYVGGVDPPSWLTLATLLAMHAGSAARYRDFVEQSGGHEAARPGLLSWAIGTLLDELEHVELVELPALERAVTMLIFDAADPSTRAALADSIASDPGARRVAMHRARKRAEAMPLLHDLARRALELAA